MSCYISTLLLSVALCIGTCESFSVSHSIRNNRLSTTSLRYYNSNNDDDFDTLLLKERLSDMRRVVMEEEYKMPPNPQLTPAQFVSEMLNALWDNSAPRPDAGFRCLLRASTGRWRHTLYHSIGAPTTATEEQVASTLGEAMGRPRNQFAILVGEAELYSLSFPSDPLDYSDGTCWIECRLRDKYTNELLVITGWQLEQRKSDGAWLVDRIDWQDFRDEYRPGIGREEWMRICG